MGGSPDIPDAPKLKMPKDTAKEDEAKRLEAQRKRASTILTQDMEEPDTMLKKILG